jgi:hypothetical protein
MGKKCKPGTGTSTLRQVMGGQNPNSATHFLFRWYVGFQHLLGMWCEWWVRSSRLEPGPHIAKAACCSIHQRPILCWKVPYISTVQQHTPPEGTPRPLGCALVWVVYKPGEVCTVGVTPFDQRSARHEGEPEPPRVSACRPSPIQAIFPVNALFRAW